jgi:hypothetical protein
MITLIIAWHRILHPHVFLAYMTGFDMSGQVMKFVEIHDLHRPLSMSFGHLLLEKTSEGRSQVDVWLRRTAIGRAQATRKCPASPQNQLSPLTGALHRVSAVSVFAHIPAFRKPDDPLVARRVRYYTVSKLETTLHQQSVTNFGVLLNNFPSIHRRSRHHVGGSVRAGRTAEEGQPDTSLQSQGYLSTFLTSRV